MTKAELKKQVEKCVEKNKPIEAFKHLETFIAQSTYNYSDLEKTILMNKTEFNIVNQQKHNKTITDEEFNKKLMRINDSILYIVKEITEPDFEESETKHPTQKEEINSIIIDDEPLGIKTLQQMLLEHCSNVKVVETFQSSVEAYEYLKNQKPDLLFLDIHMPHISGLELLKKLDYRNYNVIFTTAYKEYMLEALRLSAIDFLLKPIDKVDLISAIGRVQEELNGNLTRNQILNALRILNR